MAHGTPWRGFGPGASMAEADTTASGGPTMPLGMPSTMASKDTMVTWGIEAATSRAAAPATASRLSPHAIIRAAVFIQGAFRRFRVEECQRLAGIRPVEPAPPVAVALFSSRSLRRARSPEEVQAEAATVAAVICGREAGLLLGHMARAHSEYCSLLPPGDPSLGLLRERFHEIAVDAEEDLYGRMRHASLPSEVRRAVLRCREAWDLPADLVPEGWADPFAPSEEAAVGRLAPATEARLGEEVPSCETQAACDALEADIELELVGRPTPLRGALRRARQGLLDRTMLSVQTEFGWPPEGIPARLAEAGRWYATELGRDYPRLEDLLAATERALRRAELAAAAELAPHQAELDRLRGLIGADPPPLKLVLNGLREELEERLAAAADALGDWRRRLGTECAGLLRRARLLLGRDRFVAECREEASQAIGELAALGPRSSREPAARARTRLAAAVRLEQLLAALRAEHAGIDVVQVDGAAAAEIRRVYHLVDLYGDNDRAELPPEDEPLLSDWHQPPGFDSLGPAPHLPVPLAAGAASGEEEELFLDYSMPPPLPETPAAAPGSEPISVKMRLHGVSIDDARSKSQILFLEKCAQIIAKECRIPVEWVTDVSLDAGPS